MADVHRARPSMKCWIRAPGPIQWVAILLHKGPFVVVVEATYGDVRGKTLFINKEHIVWVEPEFEPTD